MEKRFGQVITVCLAIAMLFTGMYFERLKITSYFAEANFPENTAVIRVADPEMVVAHVRQEKEEYRSLLQSQERKSARTDFLGVMIEQCLLLLSYILSMAVLFVFLWEYRILGNIKSFIFKIISYIHEKDGDKVQLA